MLRRGGPIVPCSLAHRRAARRRPDIRFAIRAVGRLLRCGQHLPSRGTMKKTISTQKLQSLRKGTEGFLLVDVLPKEQFALDHIPGARNVPLDTVDFAKVVAEKAAGSKTRKVVVYCSGGSSEAAAKGARLLVEDGFTNVIEYEGGLASWNESKRARLTVRTKSD